MILRAPLCGANNRDNHDNFDCNSDVNNRNGDNNNGDDEHTDDINDYYTDKKNFGH